MARAEAKQPIDWSDQSNSSALVAGGQLLVPFFAGALVLVAMLLVVAGGVWVILGAPIVMVTILLAVGWLIKRHTVVQDEADELRALRKKFLAESPHFALPAAADEDAP